MKHLGDITKINGAEIEPVWCISGGSPCQDLSVAGKRKGMLHADRGDSETTRSGLFMEQIRIIKEMREHDRQLGRSDDMVRPRWAIWENVPGALSSNFGDSGFGDFGAVLEEFIRVADPAFSLPRLAGKQKWTKAGAIVGENYSLCWRIHDAQYFGVPQRRRRICVVVDFAGHTAGNGVFERIGEADSSCSEQAVANLGAVGCGEVLSVGKGLSGNLESCESARQETPPCSARGSGVDDCVANSSGGGIAGTLDASYYKGCGERQGIEREIVAYAINHQGGNVEQITEDVAGTLTAATNSSGNNKLSVAYGLDRASFNQGANAQFDFSVLRDQQPTITSRGPGAVCHEVPYTLKIRGGVERDSTGRKAGKGALIQTDLSATLGVAQDQTLFQPIPMTMNGFGDYSDSDVGSSCKMRDYKDATDLVCEPICIEMQSTKNTVVEDGIVPTLTARMGTGGNQVNAVLQKIIRWIVRRLTPLECERLQGFPDHWTDIGDWVDSKGKKHKGESDSPRYKALGNSIALPYWHQMFERLAPYMPQDATLGSLFDGIGGFPLCWESIHGKGTARWASEIEEFPIAVTKLRFGDDLHESM